MKNMTKRGFPLLLALAVLVACAACGGEKTTNSSNEIIANAAFSLGSDYYFGTNGVEQDYEKAREHFEQAETGKSLMYLGVMYENGQGVEQDYNKAREYYEQAIALGVPNLEEKVAELQAKLNG